jgi:hypothetical protein
MLIKDYFVYSFSRIQLRLFLSNVLRSSSLQLVQSLLHFNQMIM